MVDKLPWIDIETTGLDPQAHDILEIACAITDVDLNILNKKSWLINNVWFDPVDEYIKYHVDPFVYQMHVKSGLIKDLEAVSTDKYEVKHEVISFLKDNGIQEKQAPMCGSSIHFDRAFLKVHMPSLEGYFHYRNIDVSTLLELSKRWAPDLPSLTFNKQHRALSDIEESIKLLRYYKDNFIRLSEKVVRSN